ncbi:MAG: chemotaxis protein CheW [Bacteroidetes bacterium]|nr:chemotaxis protein CheW [Bacteroidota bacterium]MBU1114411.1 chemotaxis protein CheW [Bacteroidota bacterium]MBU1797212.1 chemotaxis protein CheW [Bacteroidota bacterium]
MKKKVHKGNGNILVFSLDEPHYALYLSEIERVIRSVEIIPLPKAPDVVSGVINFHGEIIPVVDIRNRFRLPSRDINLDDRFIIARTSKRLVVIIVDSVDGVFELDSNQIVDAGVTFPYTEYLSGIAKIENVIVLINDLENFLSLDEHKKLNKALSGDKE